MEISPANNKFFFLGAFLALVVFIFDLLSPVGIAGGVPYVSVVLITLWISGKNHTYFSGFIATSLTILGFFLSPVKTIPTEILITNRALAILGIWIAVIVILKNKDSNAKMLQAKQRLEALFYYATEGILVVNERGEIVLINPKASELFGYEKKELSGKNIETLLPARFRENHVQHRRNFQKNPEARTMGISDDGIFGRKKDGTEFPVEISLTYNQSEQGMFVVAFINDISLRKKQDDLIKKSIIELKHYSDELKATNSELENFAFISSHDLQEPLRKIQTFAEKIKTQEGQQLGEQAKDYLERILSAAKRMHNLINDLLTFSRLSTGLQKFETVDLNRLFAEVISDLEISIEKSGAKITSTHLPTITAEPTQMRQLFQNMLSNSMKFRKENSSPVIKISSRENRSLTNSTSEYHDIIFEDNGIGFDEKYSEKIFNVFQRLEGHKYEGSGIGLAICRKIAMRHGGEISVKSQVGIGSNFIVTLASNTRADCSEKIKKDV